MTKFYFRIVTLCAVLLFFSLPALAHPGNTDSYGGHYCWSNCLSWGYTYGSYHYHDYNYYDYDYSYSTYTPPVVIPTQTVAGCSLLAWTFDEVNNFNNIYKELLLRDARCDELVFHVQHVTPHEKLRDQLVNSVEYDYARDISLNSCEFRDNGGWDHANMIDDTYQEIIGRHPTCDEFTNHALWQTSYERLKEFLEPYGYKVYGYIFLDGAPLTNVKVSFFQNGDRIGYANLHDGYTSFYADNILEPYTLYRVKVEYEDQVINRKIRPLPYKNNEYYFKFKSQ